MILFLNMIIYFRISKQDHDSYVASLDKEQAELEKVKFMLRLSLEKALTVLDPVFHFFWFSDDWW